MRSSLASLVLGLALVAPSVAVAKPPPVPTADVAGSADHPLLRRYEGSLIVSQEKKGLRELSLPLSKLERVPEQRDNHNNAVFEPKQKKQLVGAYTRLIYLIPPDRSPLEVVGNYADEVKRQGGKVLFECSGDSCGGDPKRGNGGGGGHMSLTMYLYPRDSMSDPHGSVGACLVNDRLTDRRYLAAELPQKNAHVSVYSFTVEPNACEKALGNRTVALVQVVEGKARESKMVTVSAGELAQSIAEEGRAAVYGIYFDSNQAEVKPESEPTLEQIAKMLQERSSLKVLIVGHTDNVGGYDKNVDLSQRRAKAVVQALVSRHKISADRLTPVGVSSAAPLGSNKSDDGRAKNRRVEIVER
jgi:OmpA-OmpF porin, OOP family